MKDRAFHVRPFQRTVRLCRDRILQRD